MASSVVEMVSSSTLFRVVVAPESMRDFTAEFTSRVSVAVTFTAPGKGSPLESVATIFKGTASPARTRLSILETPT